ncbi:MAG: fused MFS/spermidine synthase [Eubacterium sp.]|nr:fused MFS/spermidine synthase [Eubacterium sp.]
MKSNDFFPRNGRVIYLKDYAGYGQIAIREDIEHNALVRILTIDDVRESATFIEDGKRYDLYFKYTRDLVAPLEKKPDIKDVLLLGGAGFSIPKYIISHYPEVHIDVVELKREMYELAMDYFYLDQLYAEYNLHEDNRMDVYILDANDYIYETKRKYDLIINDAYIGNNMDDDLVKDARVKQMKKLLNPNGVYIINLITAVKGPSSMPGILEWEILKNNYKNTDMFPVKKEAGALEKQNVILTATDGPWVPVR